MGAAVPLFPSASAEFLAHYHKRSNVETAVHHDQVEVPRSRRSKTETAMHNEVLYKILRPQYLLFDRSVMSLGSIRFPDHTGQPKAVSRRFVRPRSARYLYG